MLEIIVTLSVCAILFISYIVSGIVIDIKQKKEQERRERFIKAVSKDVDKLSIKLVD